MQVNDAKVLQVITPMTAIERLAVEAQDVFIEGIQHVLLLISFYALVNIHSPDCYSPVILFKRVIEKIIKRIKGGEHLSSEAASS